MVPLCNECRYAAEGADKVGIGLEACPLTRLLHGDRFAQQLTGKNNPPLDHIFHNTEARHIFEYMTQVILADGEVFRQIIQREGFREMILNILQNRQDLRPE